MAASGPGVTNLITGIAHAWADCTPVIALGGAAPVVTWHHGAFQEIDQLAIFKPMHQVVGPGAPREPHPRADQPRDPRRR